MAGDRLVVCKTSEVDEGSPLKVETNGLILAVFAYNGAFYVTDDTCTHGPGSLSEGYLDGCNVECDFHNGVFDFTTGAVVSPPCIIPLKTYPVTIDGDDVTIEL